MLCCITTMAFLDALPSAESPISATTLPASKLDVPVVSPVKRASNESRTIYECVTTSIDGQVTNADNK